MERGRREREGRESDRKGREIGREGKEGRVRMGDREGG